MTDIKHVRYGGMVDIKRVKIGVLVQARCNSTRLPEKYKAQLCGVSSLRLTMERLSLQCGLSNVNAVICPKEDAHTLSKAIGIDQTILGIDDFVLESGHNDVRNRYLKAAEELELDYVVRVCGDRPLVDGGVVDATIVQHLTNPSVTKNTITYSHDYEFVRGFGCEVFHVDFLKNFATESGRQHVTLDSYSPTRYKVIPLMGAPWLYKKHNSVDWDLDTLKDQVFIDSMLRKVINRADPWHIRAKDLLEHYQQ
jgi:spore coat polysaccharide biosynthesis protein SpsF (cytidylyltransferase family)